MLRDARHRLEYLLARGGLAAFNRLSLTAAIRMAQTLGDGIYVLDSARRRVAVDNILRAGLASSPAGARRLARASFRHFAAVIVEGLRASSLLGANADDPRWTWEIHPASQVLIDDPERSLILAGGHLGNWEIGAQALAQRKPLTAIARNLSNPYLNRYLRQINPRNMIRQIPKYGEHPFRLLELLRKGEVLGLMIDQHARQQIVRVDFFGRPASSYAAVALLPMIARCPLCFGACIRTGNGRFTMILSEPLTIKRTGNRNADVVRILTDLNQRLEAMIRRYPEQYLWAHRRWRDPPPEHDRP